MLITQKLKERITGDCKDCEYSYIFIQYTTDCVKEAIYMSYNLYEKYYFDAQISTAKLNNPPSSERMNYMPVALTGMDRWYGSAWPAMSQA